MDPVSITICGAPSRETLAALCELAIQAGLGLMLQPRVAAPVVETVKVLPARKAVKRTPKRVSSGAHTMRAKGQPRSATPPPERPASSRQPPNKAAAAARREAVIGQLRRVGAVGLSFKGLLDAMRMHLKDAGDQDQQVAALRNALTILGNERRVTRVAGQWVSQG